MKIIGRSEFPPMEFGTNNENIAFDLTNYLRKKGTTLSSCTWSSRPTGLTFSSESHTNYVATVNVDVSGAKEGKTYIVNCQFAMDDGTKRIVKAEMRVLDRDEFD